MWSTAHLVFTPDASHAIRAGSRVDISLKSLSTCRRDFVNYDELTSKRKAVAVAKETGFEHQMAK